MQSQTAFDTHAFVKRLTGAGMPESQAAILAQGQSDLSERPVTKKHSEFTLKHDFEKFRAELKYELNAAEHRLTIKLGAIIIIGMTVLKAALA